MTHGLRIIVRFILQVAHSGSGLSLPLGRTVPVCWDPECYRGPLYIVTILLLSFNSLFFGDFEIYLPLS